MFGKRFPLAPRSTGELDVWAQVCVKLSESMPASDGVGPPMVGYYRNLGVRISGPQPRGFLERLFPDGVIDWSDTEVSEVEPSSLDRELRNCVTAPDADGVWYRSGRMYFSEESSGGAV